MRTTQILSTFLILILSSSIQIKAQVRNSDRKELSIESNLLFNSQIGSDNLKTEVLIFDLPTETYGKELLIKLNKDGETVFTDTLSIEMDNDPLIELKEINGDNKKDLLIEYLRPGRGGNNVSMAFVFNESELCLERISNSIFFPNLVYDKDLRFISSFRFYGGDAVQMDYLELKDDTLLPKHRIIKEVSKIYLQRMENGSWIDVGERTLVDDTIVIPEVTELEPTIKIKDAN